MIRLALVCLISPIMAVGAFAQEKPKPVDDAALRAAAARPFRLVQKSQEVFYKRDACNSCHHQILPVMMESMARTRGVEFDAKIADTVKAKVFSHFKDIDAIIQGPHYIDDISDAWELLAAHAAGVPPSLATSAKAQFLASAQRLDGGWRTMDARPPQSHGRFTSTAVSVRAVQLYLPEQFKDEKQAVLARARSWLAKATPRTTEDRTYQLLGLLWSEADMAAREKAARQLLEQQRADGGWAQLPDLKSDAYSTGEVLLALHQAAKLPTDAPAYQRGLRFLLKSQEADGSWRVESRLQPAIPVSPDYFNAGFPHGRRDQFLSIMGTSLGAMALMQGIAPTTKKVDPPALPDFAPAEKDEWIHITLNGTVADLKTALKNGMKANAKTARGTTALMLAARDPAKVKLLLQHGADVNARAESGFTALLVAARFRGNAEVVRLLLKQGAKVNADKNVKVINNASALVIAASSGDVDTARALIDAGANVEDRMMVLGVLPVTPLLAATLRGDNEMAAFLLKHKADPNAGDPDTPLARAIVNNQAETVKLLLAKGANVNLVDPLGMTPLHYAASVPFDEPAIVEALLAAGAKREATDKQGRTALELARAYSHAAVEKALKSRL
jgi:ankyrin repeat protein